MGKFSKIIFSSLKRPLIFCKIIILLVLTGCAFNEIRAATYYFSSSSGDDTRTSTQAQNSATPFRSLHKLNSLMAGLQAGDVILFRSGEVFDGSLNVTKSGITFGSYGSGSKPVINGFAMLSGWTSVGNGVWESSCNSCGSGVNMVLVNGEPQAMGRYPNRTAANGGYLMGSSSGGNSVSSPELSLHNWSGAELVTRTNRWIIDRNKITSQSGSTVSFTPASTQYTVGSNSGFFIQNHPATLDVYGEWYFDPRSKKLRVFFGSTNPSSIRVEASAMNDLVSASGVNNLVFENLTFNGGNTNGFKISNGDNIRLNNCEINYAGVDGINASYTSRLQITNSSLRYANSGAMYLFPRVSGSVIQNNKLENTAIFPGMGGSGDFKYQGIMIYGGDNLIEGNRVLNTGYNPIAFLYGSNNVIRKNFIDNFCFVKDDGAGIHTWNNPSNPSVYTGQQILDNIVLNGKGTTQGTGGNKLFMSASGIYIDDNAANIEISGNTVANCKGAGLFIHNAHELEVQNNLFYNNADAQVYYSQDHHSSAVIKNVNLYSNILFAGSYGQQLTYIHTNDNNIAQFGASDQNYLSRPFDPEIVAYASYVAGGKKQWQAYDLADWQQTYNKDQASGKSPLDIPAYGVNRQVGSNKFGNGSFSSNASGAYSWAQAGNIKTSWNSGGKLDGGALEVSYGSGVSLTNPAHITIPVGAVSSGNHYIVKFSSLGSRENGSIGVTIRKSGAPYNDLIYTKYVKVNGSRGEHELLFSLPETERNASLVLQLRDADGTMWFDNVEMYEADIALSRPEDHILFEYNATNSPKAIALDGAYIGVDGTPYSGSVHIAPFASVVLIKNEYGGSPALVDKEAANGKIKKEP